MWQSVGLTLLVIVATLVCALLFMLFALLVSHLSLLCLILVIFNWVDRCYVPTGFWTYWFPFRWYVVWQLFLSKFKFLRELVGDGSTPQAEPQPSETKSERTASAPTRSRPRTARQRVAFTESTS